MSHASPARKPRRLSSAAWEALEPKNYGEKCREVSARRAEPAGHARQPPAGNQPVTGAQEAGRGRGRGEGRGRGRGQGQDHKQRPRPRPEAEAEDKDEAEANERGDQHARARRKPGRGEQGPRARTRARAPPEPPGRRLESSTPQQGGRTREGGERYFLFKTYCNSVFCFSLIKTMRCCKNP